MLSKIRSWVLIGLALFNSLGGLYLLETPFRTTAPLGFFLAGLFLFLYWVEETLVQKPKDDDPDTNF